LSGALVLNNTKEKVIFENGINHNSVMEIYNFTRRFNTTLNAVSKHAFISPEINFYTTCEAIENRLPFEVKNFEELKQGNIYKINLINEDKKVQEEMSGFFKKEALVSLEIEEKKDYKKNLFGNLDFIPEDFKNKYSIMKTTPYTLEVIHKDTNKGIALEKLANYLGIKREEIIAIGDSGNDEHMIEYAGLGIAMGNAFKSIKEKADFITLTNQEDGVANAINKFILN
ncbi:MAG: HAD-IIB family hydrolase, partial [Clostridiaceae bacterium]